MLYEVRYLDKFDRWVYTTVRAVSVKQAVFLTGLRHRNGYINRLLGTEKCQVKVIEEPVQGLNDYKPIQLSLDFSGSSKGDA